MKKINKALWAKKKEYNGRMYWLSLYQHSVDAKDIAGLLWEHWLNDGQKRHIEESLDVESYGKGKNLAMFLAAVHDLGKATPAFQAKKSFNYSGDLDGRLLENLEMAGFTGISSLSLESPEKTPHNIAGQNLLLSYGVHRDISILIGGHHGKPSDYIDKKEINAYYSNYFQTEDRESHIARKWASEQKKIFEWALNISGFCEVEDLPRIKQPAQVLLLGLLIMTDWLSSNEEYFPLVSIDEEDVPNISTRSEIAFEKWRKWKEFDNWEPEFIPDIEEIYKDRFGFSPREIQDALYELIENTDKPGIVILEAPMGIGKTEAALVAVEQLAYKSGRSGMFFGLPTQATSNGIFSRILEWLPKIKNDEDEVVTVRLAHGKAYLNEKFASLAKGIDIDGELNSCVAVNEWFSGKKTAALDDFVVGTVDQFLMLALKQRHLPLRHLGFSKKVVVIDEVHAYDAYMSQYLMRSISWMGTYGVPVVILSATLPEERRVELIKSYMLGRGIKFTKEERAKISRLIKTDAYPLITYNDGSSIFQKKDFDIKSNKKIVIKKLLENNLLEEVENMMSGGGIVGIIVNTVKRAQEISKMLSEKFGDDKVFLLHSNFIATERVKKENELMGMIGKGAIRPQEKIVVGTQVIEQSLDIDFDVLISDLSPMDLLIQRMGRLQRHDISRPNKHKTPIFYVMGESEELEFESGSSYVYGDYLLARTQYYLPETMDLPKDISKLVQKVYSSAASNSDNSACDDMFLSEDLSEKYIKFKKAHFSKIKKKEDKAQSYRVSEPSTKNTKYMDNGLMGWLKNPNPNESEEYGYAQVRDTEDSIEVIALKKAENGYGLFGQDEDISNMLGNREVERMIAKNTLRLPTALIKTYGIDRIIKFLEKYNNEHLKDWRESSWLSGSLGIIFDENNEFIISEKIRLVYDVKYGLFLRKEQ